MANGQVRGGLERGVYWHQAIWEIRDQDGVEIGFPGLLPRFVCPLLDAWARSVLQRIKSVEVAQGIGELGGRTFSGCEPPSSP